MRNFRWEVLLKESMRVRIAWATMLAALVGMGSGVITLSSHGESEPVGRTFEGRSLQEWLSDIGPAACTPDSVRVLAGLALRDGNDPQARIAVDTLTDWGTRAAAAIPELLQGLRAQTSAV